MHEKHVTESVINEFLFLGFFKNFFAQELLKVICPEIIEKFLGKTKPKNCPATMRAPYVISLTNKICKNKFKHERESKSLVMPF